MRIGDRGRSKLAFALVQQAAARCSRNEAVLRFSFSIYFPETSCKRREAMNRPVLLSTIAPRSSSAARLRGACPSAAASDGDDQHFATASICPARFLGSPFPNTDNTKNQNEFAGSVMSGDLAGVTISGLCRTRKKLQTQLGAASRFFLATHLA
jgi:hypothetical protein